MHRHEYLTIVGCGSVASFAAKTLFQSSECQITHVLLCDDGIVEEKNLKNQAFEPEHVGMLKVHALALQIRKWKSDVHVIEYSHRVKTTQKLRGTVFLCVDSMKSRHNVMSCIYGNQRVLRVIETRMDSSEATIYTFDPSNQSHKREWEDASRYTDAEAENEGGCHGPSARRESVMQVALVVVEQYILAQMPGGRAPPNRIQLWMRPLTATKKYWCE